MRALPPPLNNWSSCPYFITPIPHKPSGTLHYHKSDLLNRSIKQIFPGGSVVRIHLQCRRHRFDPWVRKIPWRRKRQPTPVFLPGISYGQRSLAGYSPRGCKRVGHKWVTKQQQQTTKQIICIMGSRLTPYSAWYSNNLVPFTYPVSYPAVHSGLCMRAHTHTCMHASTDLISQLGSLNVSILCLLTPRSFLKPNISKLELGLSKAFPELPQSGGIPPSRITAVLCDSLTAHITACSLSLWFMFSDPPKWLCAPQRQTLWLVPPAINFHCLVWSRCLINVSCFWFSVHEKMWKITEDSLWQKHQTSAVSRSRWKSA